ncbi:Crp/Fnr family transcriptional regulator [Mucilaginibacter sp.]|uniref:Crp/Fnr family transcriptional regulator n=1 Tax=Mucilaginibacter sp. TaxID=1882438 RepID=UPI003D095BDB
MEKDDFRQYVNKVAPLSDEGFELLQKISISKKLKKGECLLKAGQVCAANYIVQSGYLRTFYHKDGVDINTHFAFEGGLVTNLKSIKSGQPSAYTIEAGEASDIWIIDRAGLNELCALSPEIMLFSRRLLSNMLIDLEEHSTLFKIYTPAERYQYIEKNKPGLLQRVSLSQLASYLGVTRETLSRIRRKK